MEKDILEFESFPFELLQKLGLKNSARGIMQHVLPVKSVSEILPVVIKKLCCISSSNISKLFARFSKEFIPFRELPLNPSNEEETG